MPHHRASTGLLRVPVFDDPEQARRAWILHWLLVGCIVIVLPLIPLSLFLAADPVPLWGLHASVVLAAAGGLVLMHRGRLLVAAAGFVVICWLVITKAALDSGGLHAPGVVGYPVLTLMASYVLGRRAGIGIALASVAATLLMAVLMARGALPTVDVGSGRMWMGVATAIAAAVVFVELGLRAEEDRRRYAIHLRHAVEAADVGTWEWDAEAGRLVWAENVESVLGLPPAEFGGTLQAYLDLVHPEDRPAVRDAVRATLTADTPLIIDHRIRTGDGAVRWVAIRGHVTDRSGHWVRAMAGTIADITDRWRAQEALRRSERRLSGVVASMMDGFVLAATDGRILSANPAACGILGYGESELRVLSIWDIDAREGRDAVLGRIERMRADAPPERMETVCRCRDGSEILVELTVMLLPSDHGPLVAAFMRDITHRTMAERALRRRESQLAEAQRLAAMGSWEWNIESGEVSWSRNLFHVLGIDPKRETPSYERFRASLHPEDRNAVDALVQRALDTGQPFTFERRIVWPDGSVRQFLGRGEIVRNEEGRPIRMLGSGQDVTEQKRAEQTLRESEEKYRLLFEHSPVGIGIADMDGNLLAFNDAMLKPGGYTRDDIDRIGNVAHLYADGAEREQMFMTLRERGIVHQQEVRFLRRDGGAYDATLNVAPVSLDGEPCLLAIVQDVSDRKRAEAALQVSEERYRTLVERLPDGVYRSTHGGRLLEVNPAMWRMLGYANREDLLAVDVTRDLYFDPREREAATEMQLKEGRAEFRLRRKDGTPIWVEDRGAIVRDESGRISFHEGMLRDVTERHTAEEAVRRSREQLRRLAARLQAVREEERSAMAREIHDELGQALTGVKMDLAWMMNRLPAELEGERERGVVMMGLIDDTISAVRDLSTRLRPAVLDDLGLAAAVEWQAREFQRRMQSATAVEIQVDEIAIDGDRATALFRILQEALTNVIRHARATRVAVVLRRVGESAVLQVTDDGRGIPAADLDTTPTLGLLGMRERANAVGGSVDIRSEEGGGTAITARVPLEGSAPEGTE